MRLSDIVSSKNHKKVGIPVEAFAFSILLTCAFFSVNSRAETGPTLKDSQSVATTSSWDDQPSWATGSSPYQQTAPVTHKKTSQSEYSNGPTAPYAPGTSNVALDVGQVFLMGNLGNTYSDSIGEQVHYTYGVSDLFGFDSSLGYSSHSGGEFSMVTALTGIRLNLSYYDKIIPYAIGGLGFYKPTYTLSDSSSASSVLFGLHVGAGVDLELTRTLFFGAALTLHDVFGSVQPVGNQQIAMGGSFASFLIHAGVTF